MGVIFDILIFQYFQVTRQGLDALRVCLLHEDGDTGLNRCRQGASICMKKKNEINFKDVPIETEALFEMFWFYMDIAQVALEKRLFCLFFGLSCPGQTVDFRL